ncbi:glycoside hydrolase family 15 protein [Arhodomonas sp. SL1]|uniref:glycoside hydrolase family 15 protein n=1 Tax=Arhodomonas sp. SL1 TaxID=3425691 RepID=UPI003F884310
MAGRAADTAVTRPSLELGLVGNGQIAALVDEAATVVWGCFPRFDGDPLFSRLLDDRHRGLFAVDLTDRIEGRQYYQRNTAILHTELTDAHGGRVRITDFAPRFKQYQRTFRPVMLVRRVEPLSGAPHVRVRLRPTSAWGTAEPTLTHGSNHIRYVCDEQVLRLTTDAPLTYLLEERGFVLHEPLTFILGPDETLAESVPEAGARFLERTRDYWEDWVRSLAIPLEWQQAVIRAAITLKLSSFEPTGAIIAAVTTSIPEAPGTGRNWDYRFCWLRDAYFVVRALNRLGATRTMEHFIHFIVNLVAEAGDTALQPVYGITGERQLEERTATALAGYRGERPVRMGNDAFRQDQHDVYGAVVLAATQAFFDERLDGDDLEPLFHRLEGLGERAAALFDQPDAGIWEYRGRREVHTYSSVMCWAACDRLARIAARLGLGQREAYWAEQARHMHAVICAQAWNARLGHFVDRFGGADVDASLLLFHELGFLDAGDPRFVATVGAVERELQAGDHLFRYRREDDFGRPDNAFNVCTFWFIDALAAIGRTEEARALFANMLDCRTRLGLMSEDLDVNTAELWGNFPQTYSMVGIISTAMRLSRGWEDAF